MICTIIVECRNAPDRPTRRFLERSKAPRALPKYRATSPSKTEVDAKLMNRRASSKR